MPFYDGGRQPLTTPAWPQSREEAQAMARIAHPNVVHVYEVGQDHTLATGQVFIAMEFVAGVSLTEWQRQHRQSSSLDALVRLYLQAAAGLEAAHRSGLIHRGLVQSKSPTGIFVSTC